MGPGRRPVGCFSRKLTSAEAGGIIANREIVDGIKYYRSLLFGKNVTVFTDQRSLLHFLTKDTPGCFMRFQEKLDKYNLCLKYMEGRCNISYLFSRFTSLVDVAAMGLVPTDASNFSVASKSSVSASQT